MQTAQLSNVEPMPGIISKAQVPDKPNPMTPKIKPPRSSQIAAAVIDCSPLISRKRVSELVEPYKPWLATLMRSVPELDPEGEPTEQFTYAYSFLGWVNIARKCIGIDIPELTKAEGQESANLVHFESRAIIRYTP